MAPGTDISPFVAAAEEAAQAAGSLIRDSWQQVKQIHYKSSIDLVTTIDHQSEERIVSILHKRFPTHSILAEEETNIEGQKGEYRWIIDPVDGTTNFAHAYPHFCISIAHEFAIQSGRVMDNNCGVKQKVQSAKSYQLSAVSFQLRSVAPFPAGSLRPDMEWLGKRFCKILTMSSSDW